MQMPPSQADSQRLSVHPAALHLSLQHLLGLSAEASKTKLIKKQRPMEMHRCTIVMNVKRTPLCGASVRHRGLYTNRRQEWALGCNEGTGPHSEGVCAARAHRVQAIA